jgi:hypothetical protein
MAVDVLWRIVALLAACHDGEYRNRLARFRDNEHPGRRVSGVRPLSRSVIAARLRAQLLAGQQAGSPEKVVERLLAIQAQDVRGARLAIRSRSSGLSAVDVDRALSRDRTLVVSWLNRGTLHLVLSEDYWWLRRLTAARQAMGSERRLRQEGVDARQAVRGVALIAKAVADDGPQTREQLRRRLEAAGVPTAGQALVHILGVASARGVVLRGPMVGAEHAFVGVEQWLGPPPPAVSHDEALATLARRYLEGHAPAGPDDLAKWAGVPLRDARAGFFAVHNELVPVGEGLMAPAAPVKSPLPAPRLLGAFDPLLHGWASRRPFVGRHAGVVTTNGIFRPVALVRGRVVATWAFADGRPTVAPLEPLSTRDRRGLSEDGADVLRFLGLPQNPVRFD